MKPWIIGENNPYGNNPRFALYPAPEGSSGWRLCVLILGLRTKEYIRGFERRNLLATQKWSAREARVRANGICLEAKRAPIVLLGAKVAAAFGYPFEPFNQVHRLLDSPRDFGKVILLPHPSGRNLLWNFPANFQRARDLVLPLMEKA